MSELYGFSSAIQIDRFYQAVSCRFKKVFPRVEAIMRRDLARL